MMLLNPNQPYCSTIVVHSQPMKSGIIIRFSRSTKLVSDYIHLVSRKTRILWEEGNMFGCISEYFSAIIARLGCRWVYSRPHFDEGVGDQRSNTALAIINGALQHLYQYVGSWWYSDSGWLASALVLDMVRSTLKATVLCQCIQTTVTVVPLLQRG